MLAALLLVAGLFPQIGMYSGVKPNGEPYLMNGKLDYWTVLTTAKCDAVILDASPVADHCPEVARTIRMFNHEIMLFGTTMGAWVHPKLHVAMWDAWHDTAGTYYPELRNTVTRLDGWLYLQSGRIGMTYTNVNLADTTVGKAVADLWLRFFTTEFNGLFLDCWCPDPSWERIPNDPVDFQRMGYTTETEYWQAYKRGHRWQAEYLRTHAPAGFKLIGNCGADAEPAFDGWMRENFPRQNGGTWATNMLGWAGLPGYLTQGTQNWLTMPFTAWPADMNDGAKKWARFGLASACMGSGYFAPVGTQWDSYRGFSPWWLDEYAVDECGRSTGSVNGKGWLGEPMGEPVVTGPVWMRDFQNGVVVVNTATTQQTVRIPGGLRFLFGTSSVNTGRLAPRMLTLPAQDAVFLFRSW